MSVSTPPAQLGVLIRLTVESGSRRLDISLPDTMCVAEILPSIASRLGQLDCAIAHEGYALIRRDGTALRADLTLRDQQITDGECVALLTAADQDEPRVYDDVVEAVGDVVEADSPAWRPQDTALSVTWTGIGFVVAAVGVLIAVRPAGWFAAGGAGLLAVLMLLAAAVMSRAGEARSGCVAAMAACVVGAAAGYLVTPAGSLWGWPLVMAACGALACASAGIAVIPQYRSACAGPAVAALFLGGGGLAVALSGVQPAAAAAWVAALATAAGGTVSWLALSSTRLGALAAPDPAAPATGGQAVDVTVVRSRTLAARRMMTAVRCGLCVVIVVATPVFAAQGWAGPTLVACTGVTLLCSTRQCHGRGEVAVAVASALMGLALGLSALLVARPHSVGAVVGVLLAAAALLVGLSLAPRRVRPALGRVADAAGLVALVALVPLAVVIAGLV